jgi:hypothetical protein
MMDMITSVKTPEASNLTKVEIEKVAHRIQEMYFSLVSIYELGMDLTENVGRNDAYKLTAMNEMARSCARDLEACAEKLSGERLGYYEAKFG